MSHEDPARDAAIEAMKAAFLADEASGRNVLGMRYIYRACAGASGRVSDGYATKDECNAAFDSVSSADRSTQHYCTCVLVSGKPYSGPRTSSFFTTDEYRIELEATERDRYTNECARRCDDASCRNKQGCFYIYMNGLSERSEHEGEYTNEADAMDAAWTLTTQHPDKRVCVYEGGKSHQKEPTPCLGAQVCAVCGHFTLRREMLRALSTDEDMCRSCVYERYFDR